MIELPIPNAVGDADIQKIVVLHADLTSATYEPTCPFSIDRQRRVVRFLARSFSPFVVAVIDDVISNGPVVVSGSFDPVLNEFAIGNTSSPSFAPDGCCLGMTSYAAWYYAAHGGVPLVSAYPPAVQKLLRLRAQYAQKALWTDNGNYFTQLLFGLDELGVAPETLVRVLIRVFGLPVVLSLFPSEVDGVKHSVLAVSVNNAGIHVYDPNYPGSLQVIPFRVDGDPSSGLAAYQARYPRVVVLGQPSLGQTDDFEGLHNEAVGGFAASQQINLTSPQPGTAWSAQQTVAGTLVGFGPFPKVRCYAANVSFDIPVAGTSFSRDGVSTPCGGDIAVFAGDALDTTPRFRHSSCLIVSTGVAPVDTQIVAMPGMDTTQPLAVAANGLIGGMVFQSGTPAQNHGFVYDGTAFEIVDAVAPGETVLGTTVTGVNSHRDVVGWYQEASGNLLWPFARIGGSPVGRQIFAYPGWDQTTLEAISDDGTIVGIALNYQTGGKLSFIWRTGTFTPITSAQHYDISATSIDNAGRVLGRARRISDNAFILFVYSISQGKFSEFPVPVVAAGAVPTRWSVSDGGWIAGRHSDGTIWRFDGTTFTVIDSGISPYAAGFQFADRNGDLYSYGFDGLVGKTFVLSLCR